MESIEEQQPEPTENGDTGSVGFEEMISLYDESMRNLTEGEIVTGR